MTRTRKYENMFSCDRLFSVIFDCFKAWASVKSEIQMHIIHHVSKRGLHMCYRAKPIVFVESAMGLHKHFCSVGLCQ
jgi:hypothetical protein